MDYNEAWEMTRLIGESLNEIHDHMHEILRASERNVIADRLLAIQARAGALGQAMRMLTPHFSDDSVSAL